MIALAWSPLILMQRPDGYKLLCSRREREQERERWQSGLRKQAADIMLGASVTDAPQLLITLCMKQASWPCMVAPGQHETTRIPIIWLQVSAAGQGCQPQ